MSTQKPKAPRKRTASEAKPTTATATGVEIGRTGTNIFSGVINEEYLSELSGPRAMKKYDEMRKSDATVRASLTAIQLPIRRAQWFVTPASDEDEDKEVAEFVRRSLFEEMSITWDDFLREALLSTTYGVMVFEKVFEAREIDGINRIVWNKFAPRLPQSITAWALKDGATGIQQTTTDGHQCEIPIEKLLVFVNDKEGDNWWGISCLRAAYKHWYIKSNLEKIDAIAHERQGLGLPFVKMGINATAQDKAQAQVILSNMRAHENGYLVEPDGMSVEFKDMRASSTKDAARAIDYHDRLITKSVLAQFLNLGSGSSGSFALSQDHSALFLQSIEAIANNFADVVNKYAVRQLVDLNFNVKAYPKLDYAGISRTDVDAISVSYQRLVQVGGIKPTEEDEAYLRQVLGLPERPLEDGPEPVGDVSTDEVNRDIGLPSDEIQKQGLNGAQIAAIIQIAENIKLGTISKDNAKAIIKVAFPFLIESDIENIVANIEKGDTSKEAFAFLHSKKKVDNSEIKAAVNKRLSELGTRAAKLAFLERNIVNTRKLKEKHPGMTPVERVLSASFAELKRYIFQEENNFKSWRKLTFAEKKVNFESLQTFIDKTEAAFGDDASAMLKKSTEEYMRKLTDAVNKNDKKKIKEMELPYWVEYKAVIKHYLNTTFEFGKSNSAREMDVKAPATPNETLSTLDLMAETIATNHHYEIENAARMAVGNQLAKFGEKEIKALAAAAVAIGISSDNLVRDTAAIIVAATINQGRKLVFDKNKSKIHALQRSEILDSVTCNFCLSMDGRIVEPDDSIAKEGTFHSNCRGIWVEILKDEEELPEIGGVPNSLRDRLGDSTNDLVQPKKPIVKKDSLAAQAIAKGKAGEKDASELMANDPAQYCGCGARGGENVHMHTH